MLRVPATSAVVVHAAVRALPEPVSATAEQPASDAPPSVKLTVPVGDAPVTVAVKVTLAPTVDGFSELTCVVVEAFLLTTWESVVLVDARLPASPA